LVSTIGILVGDGMSSIVEETVGKKVESIEAGLSDEINKNLEIMEEYCQNNSDYVFNYEGNTLVIPCSVISQGSEAIIEAGVANIVDDFYYAEYNCGFWDCFEKTGSSFFLISEKAKNYWNNKFYFALIAFVILIVLMFFLVEKKTNLPLIVGSLLIISSLPFMKLNNFVGTFINPLLSAAGIPGDISSSFLSIFSIFFTKAHTVFLITLISGLVILSIGILLKIFGIGFKISNLFSKKDKKISKDKVKNIKQEVSEKKSKKSK
ncbi:unnamed protein product, partial [marine sediment metagenome]